MTAITQNAAGWRGRAYPWYAVGLFLLTYMCSSIDRLVISVVVEPLKAEYHLSDGQIGLLGGLAFSAPFAVASLPVGWLVDRLDRRLLMAAMMTVWSAATMLGATPANYTFLLGCRMLVGGSEAATHPASLSLIADLIPPRRRATAVSLFAVGPALATFIVYFGGGWLQKRYDWHGVFLIAAVPGLVLAGLIALTLRDPGRGRFDTTPSPRATLGVRETAALLFRTPGLLHAIVAHMLSTGAQFAITTWIVSLLVRVHGMTSQSAAIWIGVGMGACQTLGSLIVGPVVDRITRGDAGKLAIWLVFTSTGACLAGLAMISAPTQQTALSAMCVETLLMGMLLGPSYTLLVATSPVVARGTMLSFARLCGTLIGNSGLAYLAGFVSDRVGGEHSIAIGLGLTTLALLWAAAHYFLSGASTRRTNSRLKRELVDGGGPKLSQADA